jgi:hypothetical protein
MKINELTEKQKEKIFTSEPVWMADNRPEWMADNRPEWMADNCPEWMADNCPGERTVPENILKILESEEIK